MADCTFTVMLSPSSKNPQKTGDQFTVVIDPLLKPGCIFTVSIDGQAVQQPGDRSGDFKLVGLGAGGTATIESLRDSPRGNVSLTVRCEDCGPTTRSLPIPAPTHENGDDWIAIVCHRPEDKDTGTTIFSDGGSGSDVVVDLKPCGQCGIYWESGDDKDSVDVQHTHKFRKAKTINLKCSGTSSCSCRYRIRSVS